MDTHIFAVQEEVGVQTYCNPIVQTYSFDALMGAGRVCSLGSMSHALYEVGGEYRRNM